MLFLLNNTVIDVAVPEMHLERRWTMLGCGKPTELDADGAIRFASACLDAVRRNGKAPDERLLRDLAALIISKTGANSFALTVDEDGMARPTLRQVPAMVLETYRRGAANDGAETRLIDNRPAS